jgi:hypothetical protein
MPHFGGKNAKKKSSSSTTKRNFTVVIGSKEHGLYVSSSPSSAARKAVSKLCATDKKRKVSFHIREITQGSKKKTYGPYLGYIEKLAKPIELKGRVIKYKPVAKLSGKTGKKTAVKKGGMRGGDKNIYIETNLAKTNNMPYFRLITDKDLSKRISTDLDFLPEGFPVQFMKYNTSPDRKTIHFRFCNPASLNYMSKNGNDPSSYVNDRLISYLQNLDEDEVISKSLEKLGIIPDRILLYIPYIDSDTKKIIFEEHKVYTKNGNGRGNGN